MDTLFSKVKSLAGYTCAQLITNGTFTRVYPMTSKSSASIAAALSEFTEMLVFLADTLICDFASEQTGKNTDVIKLIQRLHIRLHIAEKSRGTTQNHRAETEIREVKPNGKRVCVTAKSQHNSGITTVLCTLPKSNLYSRVAQLNGQALNELWAKPWTSLNGWLDFKFYDCVWYWDEKKTDMNESQARIGLWLGIAHHVAWQRHDALDPH